jgi:tetratricopeptide (TPR) repeat protein
MDAVNRALEEEVADETLPLQERMAYLPVMAGNDFAQSRFAAAMEKYELLLRYHAPAGNYAMAAFALNGMGEVYERTGDLERANQSFEAALVPATQGEHKPITVLLNIVINLGNLCMRQERWEHGEGWFDAAQQLATAARDPTTKISSLEKLGVCQKHQDRNDDAVRSWRDGVGIAAQLEDSYSCRNLLVRLERHYASLGDYAGAREVQHLIADLEAPVSG